MPIIPDLGASVAGSEPRSGVCESWATAADACAPCSDYAFPAGDLEDAMLMASNFLFFASGRQFPGLCTDTVRPCARRGQRFRYTYSGDQDGRTYGWSCGCQSGPSCGCPTLDEISLGGWPLVSVEEVRVRYQLGGALETLVAGTDYRVDDWARLVRLTNADGTNDGWPCCADQGQESSSDGVFFEVDYTYGRSPGIDGIRAAAVLGCEFAIACQPETAGLRCRLPKKTTSVVRNNITVNITDPATLFLVPPGGGPIRTGLPEVDAFLSAHNPAGIDRPARFINPDAGRRVRRAGT